MYKEIEEIITLEEWVGKYKLENEYIYLYDESGELIYCGIGYKPEYAKMYILSSSYSSEQYFFTVGHMKDSKGKAIDNMNTNRIDVGYENLKDDEWRNWLNNLSEEELIEVYKKSIYNLEHEDPKIKHERYESMVRASIEEDADDDWSEYELSEKDINER